MKHIQPASIPPHEGSSLVARWVTIGFVALIVMFGVGAVFMSVRAAQEASRKMSCSNNLKQLGLAIHTYHDTYNIFPTNGLYFTTGESNSPYVGSRASHGSVLVKLMPYVESSPFYNGLRFDVGGSPWEFEAQRITLDGKYKGDRAGPTVKAYRYDVPSYKCPSSNLDYWLDLGESAPAASWYAPSLGAQRMPGGSWCRDYPGDYFGSGPAAYGLTNNGGEVSGTFSRRQWAAKFRDITDGQSQVITFGEILPNKSLVQSRGWVRSDSLCAATTSPINFPVTGMGERGFPGAKDCHHYANRQTSDGFRSMHKGGAQFVMADGSTQFLMEIIDYRVYQRLGDRSDGQPLGNRWITDQTPYQD